MHRSKSIRRVEITVDRRVRSVQISGTSGLQVGEACPLCGRVIEATADTAMLSHQPCRDPQQQMPELPELGELHES